MEGNKILQAEDISVSYGVVKALRGVSMDVMEGEIVTLVGANNAGKSTLLKAILGINRVDSGRILYRDQEITHALTENIVASGICLVPEGRGVIPTMSVLENLQLGAYHHNDKLKANLEMVFHRFPRIKTKTSQIAGTLSGGEQQMLAIARGLMSMPKIMMFDEPSLGLSPIIVEEVFKIIVELKQSGMTIVLSEQNARKSLQISQRGYVIERGKVVLSGESMDLAKNEKMRHAYLGGGVQ